MNQILMMEDKKKKRGNSGTTEISSIVRFFAIVLIIFGVFFIGQGSYALYKESKGKNTDNLPIVNIERVNDTAVVTVSSTNKITNLVYNWNKTDQETKIPVDDTYVREEITLLMGNNTLYINIEEENGRTVKYEKQFNLEGIDTTKPTIDIADESSTGNIKITATDETEISYITYQINDEEEVRIDKTETDTKTMNYILSLPKGENKVIITAVDNTGNIETLEKTIIVSGKTNIYDLKVENGRLVFTAEDPDGIKDIEINLNGQTLTSKDLNKKKVTVRIPIDLVEGTNTLRITVTNVNSLVTTGAKEFNYAK